MCEFGSSQSLWERAINTLVMGLQCPSHAIKQTHLDNNPLFVTNQCTVPDSSTNHRPSSIPLYQILCLGHHVSSIEIQTLLSLQKQMLVVALQHTELKIYERHSSSMKKSIALTFGPSLLHSLYSPTQSLFESSRNASLEEKHCVTTQITATLENTLKQHVFLN